MIYTRYGSEVRILAGNLETGEVNIQYYDIGRFRLHHNNPFIPLICGEEVSLRPAKPEGEGHGVYYLLAILNK